MLTKKRYSVKEMLLWTRGEIFIYLSYAAVLTVLYEVVGLTFLNVPWTPVALIGTAVAFMVGFQNNAAYERIWEARKIWGSIVNTSRTWGMKVQDLVRVTYPQPQLSEDTLQGDRRILVYRHIAWLTALRYAMRERKSWETTHKAITNQEWRKRIHTPEYLQSLKEGLTPYLVEEEYNYVLSKTNKQTAILYLQSKHLRHLYDKGVIGEFTFLNLENVLEELFTHQGKTERIKNFPYPRQYATLSLYLTRIFAILLPFGIIPEFAEIGEEMLEEFNRVGLYFVWLAIPFCAVVSWAFHVMERMARVGENPFEGTSNDVPISTISRSIEINLREMLDEENDTIPNQFPEEMNVQM